MNARLTYRECFSRQADYQAQPCVKQPNFPARLGWDLFDSNGHRQTGRNHPKDHLFGSIAEVIADTALRQAMELHTPDSVRISC